VSQRLRISSPFSIRLCFPIPARHACLCLRAPPCLLFRCHPALFAADAIPPSRSMSRGGFLFRTRNFRSALLLPAVGLEGIGIVRLIPVILPLERALVRHAVCACCRHPPTLPCAARAYVDDVSHGIFTRSRWPTLLCRARRVKSLESALLPLLYPVVTTKACFSFLLSPLHLTLPQILLSLTMKTRGLLIAHMFCLFRPTVMPLLPTRFSRFPPSVHSLNSPSSLSFFGICHSPTRFNRHRPVASQLAPLPMLLTNGQFGFAFILRTIRSLRHSQPFSTSSLDAYLGQTNHREIRFKFAP